MKILDFIAAPFVWLIEQINWLKAFFNDEKNGKPSIGSLLRFWITVSWIGAFVKTVVATKSIPDITGNWMMVIIAMVYVSVLKAIIRIMEKRYGLEDKKDAK